MDSVDTQPPWKRIHPWIRFAGSVLFVTWMGVVIAGGFSWPTGLQLASWPWNQSWFMFYRSSGKQYFMQARGRLTDGTPVAIDTKRYFAYRAAFISSRFNEAPRDVPSVRKMAAYLCKKYNQTAPVTAQLAQITVWDTWWMDRRGVRRDETQVPAADKQTWSYITDESCEKLHAETGI